MAVPARTVPTLIHVPVTGRQRAQSTITVVESRIVAASQPVARPDVLLVSLGSTAGLQAADDALAGSLRRAGVEVAVATAEPQDDVRTFALTDLRWARAAAAAARTALREHDPRTIVYSSMGAALLWPRPGAIRYDAPMAANRPGRHGVWQRPMERKRLRESTLLIAVDAETLAETPRPHADAVVVPIPVEPSGPTTAARDIAAVMYAADPQKKGLGAVLDAWERAAGEGDTLVVAGLDEQRAEAYCKDTDAAPGARRGVRFAGKLDPAEFRALLRRARIFVTAPRREDYGMAQLEALADGCVLVTTPAPGPYAALPIARELDLRLVTGDLARALRIALDDPMPDYAARAAEAVRRFHPDAVDRMVVERLLPRLLP
jgi:hypothetical protein